MDIDIYHAEHADLDWLVQECEEFSKFTSKDKYEIFPGKELARDGLKKLIDNQVVFMSKALKPEFQAIFNDLAINGGTFKPKDDMWIRTGFMAGMITPHYFNPKITVFTELFWWVPIEYRRGRSGLMLFNMYLEYGKEHADQIIMTLEQESPVNHSFLTKKGFRLKEQAFLLEV